MTNLSEMDRGLIRISLESRLRQLSDVEGRIETDVLAGTTGSAQRVDLALAEVELHEIEMNERALAKLNSSDYGICESCSKPIAVERLRAIPATPFCLRCEARLEAQKSARRKPGDPTSPSLRPLEDEQEIPY